MADILLEEPSPFGNLVAIVEDDERVVYFYLHLPDSPEDDPERTKVCWVRNRVAAPREMDEAAMQRGEAPLMPADFCTSPDPGPPFDPDSLRIVWFEECDGAALIEEDEVLAIIPSWSGVEGFSGYARDCVGQGPFAWELGPDNAMHERVVAAEEFWTLWDDDEFWPRWRDERIAALETVLGPHAKYYAIDGDQFPPRALLRFDAADHYAFVTVGMSLFCLPGVERYVDDPAPYRRIELAAAVDKRCPSKELNRLANYLSAQARYPWDHFLPLGDGHTMPCDSTPESLDGHRFNCALFSTGLPRTPAFAWPAFRGDPTTVLWLSQISQRERQLAVNAGSFQLVQRLTRAGVDFVMRPRNELAV
jgi:hypothetical protein